MVRAVTSQQEAAGIGSNLTHKSLTDNHGIGLDNGWMEDGNLVICAWCRSMLLGMD